MLGKNVPKIDYVILNVNDPYYVSPSIPNHIYRALLIIGGGGGCHVRLCPVLFGFYETTDMFFGTLADSDGLVLQRRGHD